MMKPDDSIAYKIAIQMLPAMRQNWAKEAIEKLSKEAQKNLQKTLDN